MGIMKRKQETLLPPISDPTPPPPTQLRDAHPRKPANCVTCVVIAARDLRAADGGWLTRGSSDPYVKVIVESVAQQTTHKNCNAFATCGTIKFCPLILTHVLSAEN